MSQLVAELEDVGHLVSQDPVAALLAKKPPHRPDVGPERLTKELIKEIIDLSCRHLTAGRDHGQQD